MEKVYECRYCSEESKNHDEFISPCLCKGTMEFVHKDCLNKWLDVNLQSENYFKCSDCKSSFKRSEPSGLSNKIETENIVYFTMIESLLGAGTISAVLISSKYEKQTSGVLMVLYFISFIYCFIIFADQRYVYLCFFTYLFIINMSGSYKQLLTGLYAVILLGAISYTLITEVWDKMKKIIEKKHLKGFKSQMFDRYTKMYVDGVH